MRGVTHTLLGAAVVLPIAVSREPAVAAGCLWLGMVGGGLPDWLDLRSDFKTQFRLKHRGASHSLIVLVGCAALLYLGLISLQGSPAAFGGTAVAPKDSTVAAWVAALALGIGSHLGSDACTFAGIRPLLPFSQWKVWLLPRFLRSRSDGYLDTVVRVLALVTLAFGFVVYAGRWIARP